MAEEADRIQLAIARAIAHIAHKGQVDKAGNPYIDHPNRVAARLNTDRHKAIAWLHDVLEDTDLTRDDLDAAGVEWTIINVVEVLTRTADKTPEQYYESIAYSDSARVVKLADIADNTDPSRLALLDDATIARLTRKYAKARTALDA